MIVGLVPTYREGALAAGAVRSLLKCCNIVYVCEGPGGLKHDEGEPTNLREFRKDTRVSLTAGEWETEADKRNAMLARTRRYPAPVWGVYLDADEILTDAEYVPDLIWAASHNTPDGETPAAIPLLIQEVDASVGRIHRIFRLDLLERHVLSMSQLKFFSSDLVVTFPVVPLWRPGQDVTPLARPPMQGEPSIHHRSYYRPPVRGEHRWHKQEGEDFLALERDALSRLGINNPAGPGMVPVHQDPGPIVAAEQTIETAEIDERSIARELGVELP